jgi:hypothetical protein
LGWDLSHISHSHPIPPLRGYKMGIEMGMAQWARPVGPIPLFHIPIPMGIEMGIRAPYFTFPLGEPQWE